MPEQVTAFAPGRVNVIGEHTDYNAGLALPFAIAQGVTVPARRTGGRRIRAVALDLGEEVSLEIGRCERIVGWRGFVHGAVAELTAAGYELVAAELKISGTIAPGAGLASSAALSVALCLALLSVSDRNLPSQLWLAHLCRQIENDWVGAASGLLDQLASLSDGAVLIDFCSLEVSPIAFELGDWRFVTLDSGQRHQNSADREGYNARRAECAQACSLLGVGSLRETVLEAAGTLPDPLAARARHVLLENLRVEQTAAALTSGDLTTVGQLLDQSHASLRDLYEVSTPEVELAVERLRGAGAAGVRMIGGGFGGHVLGLFAPGAVPPAAAQEVRPGSGAQLLAS